MVGPECGTGQEKHAGGPGKERIAGPGHGLLVVTLPHVADTAWWGEGAQDGQGHPSGDEGWGHGAAPALLGFRSGGLQADTPSTPRLPPPPSPAPGFPPLENEPDRWPASRTRRDNARTCTPEVAAAASGVPSCAPRPRVPAGRS